MAQPSASAAFTASSTARAFRTGSAPGKPRHTGQTCVFGGAPNAVSHPQKIFVRVDNCAWISSPMTASYCTRPMLARGVRGLSARACQLPTTNFQLPRHSQFATSNHAGCADGEPAWELGGWKFRGGWKLE